MSIEKIERVREVMSWLDGWDGNRSASSFKGFQSITLGDIRALLDELSRLREVERRAKEVIRPFAEYMEDGMDLDNNGLPLPDEQGVGWIYLNHGRFRSARDLYRVLSEREGQDG